MLRVLGSPRRLCGGVARRDFLTVGGSQVLGFGLGDLLRLRAARAASDRPAAGKAKACILLFPYGSPPAHETFDPKPDAPFDVRGELGNATKTSVPGTLVGELLPRVATVMDRVTVVRSMTHPYPVHGVAYATTGIPTYTPVLERDPRDARHWPYIGSMVDYVLEQRGGGNPAVPRNIALPWRMNTKNGGIAAAGPYAAFLGSAYDPVIADFQGEASRTLDKQTLSDTPVVKVADPFAGLTPDSHFRIADTGLTADITLDRLDRRLSLVEQLDHARAGDDRLARAGANLDRFQQTARSLLTSPKLRQALDVRREPSRVREQYGLTLFGQGCLAARRLVEAGGTFVTVFWDEVGPINADWDTHYGLYPRLKGWLLPGFDLAFSALIRDLDQRGMLDETLVVWMSEHGRTPTVQKIAGGGRDHWSRAYSIVLAGGGVPRGTVVGRTDRMGGDVTSTPVSPKDVLATILHLLGIDPETSVPDRLGRPLRIAGEGEVRRELLA